MNDKILVLTESIHLMHIAFCGEPPHYEAPFSLYIYIKKLYDKAYKFRPFFFNLQGTGLIFFSKLL